MKNLGLFPFVLLGTILNLLGQFMNALPSQEIVSKIQNGGIPSPKLGLFRTGIGSELPILNINVAKTQRARESINRTVESPQNCVQPIRCKYRKRVVLLRLLSPCYAVHSRYNQLFGLLLAFFLFCLQCDFALAQIRDGFESGPPRLRLWKSDANAQITSHELTTTLPFTGQSSEAIEVNCSKGSLAYLMYPIQPAALIDELRANMNLRAAPRGLRMGLRVTLPESMHPASGTPAQLVLFGTANQGRGQWSSLAVDQVLSKFEEQLRILNREVGYSVDSRNAYVDAVVIDVYNGPGATRIQIDDLAIDGLASPGSYTNIEPNSNTSSSADLKSIQDVTTQVVRLQRTLPRLLQYQGESLDWLKSLGITGVLLDTEADSLLMKQAERTSMHLIAAPPNQLAWTNNSDSSRPNTIWNLASAATMADLDRTRDSVSYVSKYPIELSHPRFIEAMEGHALFSRLAEVVAFPIPMPTTVNSNREMKQLVGEQLQQAATRALPLASIVLEPPQAWIEQCRSLQNILQQQSRYVKNETGLTSLVPIRQSIAHAIGMGFRGILFRSTAALDSGQEEDLSRANAIQSLNAELELLRPWIETGQATQDVSTISNTLYDAYSIATERSTLLIFNTMGEFDQIAPVSPQSTSLEFVIPRRNSGEQAYRITHGRLESLRLAPKPDGWGIRIESPSITEYFVVTNDQVVLQYLRNNLPEYANQAASSRITTAANLLYLAQTTLHNESMQQADGWWNKLQSAETILRAATTNDAINNKPEAIQAAEQCINVCSEVLRASWLRALETYVDPRATPFLANLNSLPLHWQFHSLIRDRKWQYHKIIGDELDNMQTMQRAGWTYDRRLLDRIDHQFAIIDGIGISGQPTLQLAAKSKTGERVVGGFAGSTMRVVSAGVDLYAGRVMRVRIKAKIDQPSQEPLSGLLIYEGYEQDVFGRSTLGRPIAATTASVGKWQQVDLYRIVNSDAQARIYFEVRGSLAMTIDDLKTETLTLTPTNQNFITTPVSDQFDGDSKVPNWNPIDPWVIQLEKTMVNENNNQPTTNMNNR